MNMTSKKIVIIDNNKGWDKHDKEKVRAYCNKHGLDFEDFND
jgi:hypothetical protein